MVNLTVQTEMMRLLSNVLMQLHLAHIKPFAKMVIIADLTLLPLVSFGARFVLDFGYPRVSSYTYLGYGIVA